MRAKRSGRTKRSIKRSGRVLKKGVKFFKKHKIGQKILDHGPAVASAAAIAAGIVGTVMTAGEPAPLMAGIAASGAIKGLDESKRRAMAATALPKMVHRNDIGPNVSSSPTGSRVGGKQPL